MTVDSREFWNDRTVVVTGGAGFLGRYVVEELEQRADAVDTIVPRSDRYDLRDRATIRRLLEKSGADIVIHLAATVGGIGAVDRNPGQHFYDNAIMGIELLEQSRQFGVDKCTVVGTACSYPESASPPFSETELFDGHPEPTNAPYGIAKRTLLTQSRAYHREWGFNSLHLIPVNLYGPRDNFDLESAHVIPALIRKCIEARERNQDTVTAWGTGEQTREFLYVADAADAILDATERYDHPEPVNLGSGMEISIRRLLELIVTETGFTGRVEWDTSRPTGQSRRRVDSTRAKERFGWEATTDFRDGLRATVEWYEQNRTPSQAE